VLGTLVVATVGITAPSMAEAAAPPPGKHLAAAPRPGMHLPAPRAHAPAPRANAAPPGTFRWVDYQTGRCLDSNYNGDVYTLPCNGGPYQQWWLGPDYELCDYQTGRCIEALGQDIHAYFPSGDPSQWWYFSQEASGLPIYQVQNQQYTALCLDSNYNGNVYALGCNGGPYQAWFPA